MFNKTVRLAMVMVILATITTSMINSRQLDAMKAKIHSKPRDETVKTVSALGNVLALVRQVNDFEQPNGFAPLMSAV